MAAYHVAKKPCRKVPVPSLGQNVKQDRFVHFLISSMFDFVFVTRTSNLTSGPESPAGTEFRWCHILPATHLAGQVGSASLSTSFRADRSLEKI
jgi:hypothetical protein